MVSAVRQGGHTSTRVWPAPVGAARPPPSNPPSCPRMCPARTACLRFSRSAAEAPPKKGRANGSARATPAAPRVGTTPRPAGAGWGRRMLFCWLGEPGAWGIRPGGGGCGPGVGLRRWVWHWATDARWPASARARPGPARPKHASFLLLPRSPLLLLPSTSATQPGFTAVRTAGYKQQSGAGGGTRPGCSCPPPLRMWVATEKGGKRPAKWGRVRAGGAGRAWSRPMGSLSCCAHAGRLARTHVGGGGGLAHCLGPPPATSPQREALHRQRDRREGAM